MSNNLKRALLGFLICAVIWAVACVIVHADLKVALLGGALAAVLYMCAMFGYFPT